MQGAAGQGRLVSRILLGRAAGDEDPPDEREVLQLLVLLLLPLLLPHPLPPHHMLPCSPMCTRRQVVGAEQQASGGAGMPPASPPSPSWR